MSKRGRRPRAGYGRVQTRGVIERTQSFLIVGVCVVVGVAIIVAAAWKPVSNKIRLSGYHHDALAEVGGSPAAAGCQAPYELAVGDSSTFAAGTGTYLTATPAYGPYASDSTSGATTGASFYRTGNRPQLSDIVADEYAGYTVLWYDNTVKGSTLSQIQAIVQKFDDSADDRDELIAVPWTKADQASVSGDPALAHFPAGTHIALTHWSAGGVGQSDTTQQKGVYEYCAGVSGAALKSFMVAYPYTDSPSPGVLPTAQSGSSAALGE